MEIHFRRVSTIQYTIVYIPYTEEESRPDLQNIVIYTSDSNISSVLIATINTSVPPTPNAQEVVEEYEVVNGNVKKPEKSKSRVKDWFKCLLNGCGPALLGCAYGDGAYITCTSLICGGAAFFCALTSLF